MISLRRKSWAPDRVDVGHHVKDNGNNQLHDDGNPLHSHPLQHLGMKMTLPLARLCRLHRRGSCAPPENDVGADPARATAPVGALAVEPMRGCTGATTGAADDRRGWCSENMWVHSAGWGGSRRHDPSRPQLWASMSPIMKPPLPAGRTWHLLGIKFFRLSGRSAGVFAVGECYFE